MLPRVRIDPLVPQPVGRPIYWTEDLALTFLASNIDPNEIKKPTNLADRLGAEFGIVDQEPVFLIADTLTLSFRRCDGALFGLDAYTNRDRWVRAQWDIDGITTAGGIALDEIFDDSHVSLEITPRYEYDSETGVLNVVFDDTPCEKYRIGSNIVVGLAGGRMRSVALKLETI